MLGIGIVSLPPGESDGIGDSSSKSLGEGISLSPKRIGPFVEIGEPCSTDAFTCSPGPAGIEGFGDENIPAVVLEPPVGVVTGVVGVTVGEIVLEVVGGRDLGEVTLAATVEAVTGDEVWKELSVPGATGGSGLFESVTFRLVASGCGVTGAFVTVEETVGLVDDTDAGELVADDAVVTGVPVGKVVTIIVENVGPTPVVIVAIVVTGDFVVAEGAKTVLANVPAVEVGVPMVEVVALEVGVASVAVPAVEADDSGTVVVTSCVVVDVGKVAEGSFFAAPVLEVAIADVVIPAVLVTVVVVPEIVVADVIESLESEDDGVVTVAVPDEVVFEVVVNGIVLVGGGPLEPEEAGTFLRGGGGLFFVEELGAVADVFTADVDEIAADELGGTVVTVGFASDTSLSGGAGEEMKSGFSVGTAVVSSFSIDEGELSNDTGAGDLIGIGPSLCGNHVPLKAHDFCLSRKKAIRGCPDQGICKALPKTSLSEVKRRTVPEKREAPPHSMCCVSTA